MSDKKPFLGIIGGSGIYELNDIVNPEWTSVKSLYGSPSDEILTGSINGISIAFLPRHGRGHSLSPSNINYIGWVQILSIRYNIFICRRKPKRHYKARKFCYY